MPLLLKLANERPSEFPDVTKLIGLCTFLDGNGHKFEVICRVARAHGTKTILFLDGDQRARIGKDELRKKLPETPIILTPLETEFEELVPNEVYIRSAMELVGLEYSPDALQSLLLWTGAEQRRGRLAFSKRVEGWFRDSFDPPFLSKTVIMSESVKKVDVKDIEVAPFLELMSAIRKALKGTSFD